MRILITGGAGYIGSHAAKQAARDGHDVFVYDNLFRGNRWAVKWGPLIEGDILDEEKLVHALRSNRIDAVMHFAALAYVGESTQQPLTYFTCNVEGTLTVLRAMRTSGVDMLVFSSSCAIFGNPADLPVSESSPAIPISPYGESKYMAERILRWTGGPKSVRWVALRYFNVAGGDPDGEIGESHTPETHLIPLVLRAATDGGSPVHVFGTDHPTEDGTCVRDYVHVADIADGHLRALDYLRRGGEPTAFNLGSGSGYSVRQIIEIAEKIAGRPVDCRNAPARPGDPARVVASNERALDVLGWAPVNSSLERIVSTAWNWHCSELGKQPGSGSDSSS